MLYIPFYPFLFHWRTLCLFSVRPFVCVVCCVCVWIVCFCVSVPVIIVCVFVSPFHVILFHEIKLRNRNWSLQGIGRYHEIVNDCFLQNTLPLFFLCIFCHKIFIIKTFLQLALTWSTGVKDELLTFQYFVLENGIEVPKLQQIQKVSACFNQPTWSRCLKWYNSCVRAIH